MSMKKGLAVIYDPHNLYQFLWYYCNRGKQREWDALCLPNGYKGEYMHTYCENAGIFRRIYRDDTDYSVLPMANKVRIFARMVLYWILGHRTEYCRKLLNQYVNEKEYDEIVVIADVGVISGACVALGKEKEVIILEDGFTDYGTRPVFISVKEIFSLYKWQGFVMSLMGYCSPGWFRLENDKYCIKYSTAPEKMKYTNYREIRKLFDANGTDNVLFEELLQKVYPSLSEYDYNADAVFLTTPLKSFLEDYTKYKQRVEAFIRECGFGKVLLKRHPRDEDEYYFGDNTEIEEIDNSIPAEVIFPYFRNKKAVTMALTGSSIAMPAYGIHCDILYLEGLYEDCIRSNGMGTPYRYEELDRICREFLGEDYRIIKV